MQLQCWTRTASVLAAAAVVSLLFPALTHADVKEGDTVTKANMKQAGDLLIPGVKWFVERGMPIKVGPYKKVEMPKLFRDATEKYSGQVKLSADGHEIYNYVAGLPFPNVDPNDPMAGFKLMWNQEQKPQYIDNVGTEWITELVNGKGELERTYGSQFWRRMMWTGRLYTDPKPVVPHTPRCDIQNSSGPCSFPMI